MKSGGFKICDTPVVNVDQALGDHRPLRVRGKINYVQCRVPALHRACADEKRWNEILDTPVVDVDQALGDHRPLRVWGKRK